MYNIKSNLIYFFEVLRILKCITKRECVVKRVRRFADNECTGDVASSKKYESAKIKISKMTRDNVLAGTQQFKLPLINMQLC